MIRSLLRYLQSVFSLFLCLPSYNFAHLPPTLLTQRCASLSRRHCQKRKKVKKASRALLPPCYTKFCRRIRKGKKTNIPCYMPAIAPYTKICLEKRNRKRPFPQKKYEEACLPPCHTSLEMITALRAKITQPMEKTPVMSLVGGAKPKKR